MVTSLEEMMIGDIEESGKTLTSKKESGHKVNDPPSFALDATRSAPDRVSHSVKQTGDCAPEGISDSDD